MSILKDLRKKDGEDSSSESSSDEEEILRRKIKEIEDDLKVLDLLKNPDLLDLDNVWDEDKVFWEEVPLSNRLAERRQGGKRLFKKVTMTTDALPVDKGETKR